MTPESTQRFISYVVNYANVAKNHIHENSLDSQSIANSLNDIQSCALNVIARINKGDITKFYDLREACSPIGDAFFHQLCNDEDYVFKMNEWCDRQREGHELPY